jgi:DNA-binding NarL/FixJ family response regulator
VRLATALRHFSALGGHLSEGRREANQVPSASPVRIADRLAGLTKREIEVLRLVAKGLTNGQIAQRLGISPVTVSSYLRSIYSKLRVNSRLGAMRYAIDKGML